MVESWSDKPLSRPFNIPSSRTGSIKNNESEIIALKRRIRVLEERFYGFVYYNIPTIVDIINAGEYVDLPYTGTLDIGYGVEPASGKLGLKNITQKPYLVDVQGSCDVEIAGPTTVVGLRLVKNGVPLAGCFCEATVSNNTIGKLFSFGQVWMEPNDEITMQVADISTSNDFEFERGRLRITRVPGVG